MVLGKYKMKMEKFKIAVIGLGYVGLPLARLFSTKYQTIGYDLNSNRIQALMQGHDETLELSDDLLQNAINNGFVCTNEVDDIKDCNFYIVTVPTPVDENNNPDLSPLYKASEIVGQVINRGDIVVYESTVYPGVTENECVPVIEKKSGLLYNRDFFVGYSPERINPGDKLIKVAEAAKVIENSQRDINIAFVNELSKIFSKMGIDTMDVLEAAGTKWNFLPFRPGLVGGHCIGVDPYYLAQCAQRYGYNPEIILAGRRMNDSMGEYVASQIIRLMLKKGIQVLNSNILILGFTFKEDCPDIRNTKVANLVNTLKEYNLKITIYDPWADPERVKKTYNFDLVNQLPKEKYDALVLAVAHRKFADISWKTLVKDKNIIYDIKGYMPREIVDGRL